MDVAEELGYSKASISRAMGILKDGDYVTVGMAAILSSRKRGALQPKHYERHCRIGPFLERVLDIDHKTADRDACRIKHITSPETFDRIRSYVRESAEH